MSDSIKLLLIFIFFLIGEMIVGYVDWATLLALVVIGGLTTIKVNE